MSLINQVLNDLEKRGASTNIGEATIRVVPIRRSHGTFWLFIAAVSVSILAASAWLKWGAETQSSTSPLALNAAPVAIEVQTQSASQPEVSAPVVTAKVEAKPEIAAPVSRPNTKSSTTPKVVPLALKPLLTLTPVITAVSPNPAISRDSAQAITISGSNFASDATVTLHTPAGKVYTKRKIVKQDSSKIVVRAKLANIAGAWSAEVINSGGQPEGQFSSGGQLSSGQFAFTVQAAPVVADTQMQNKAAIPASNEPQTDAKPLPAEIHAKGISKQPTQITLQQQAENEFRKAYALMQQGQTNAAISGYETAIKLDAGHNVARQTLVRLLLENKRNAEAERLLQDGLQHDPKQSSMAMLLARMLVGRNELDQALETMMKSLPYAEKQADYQSFVAALLQRKNRHKEAITHFQNALQISPKSGVWLMGLGISLRAEQRTDEARDAFKRALESNNLSAELQSFVKQQLKEL